MKCGPQLCKNINFFLSMVQFEYLFKEMNHEKCHLFNNKKTTNIYNMKNLASMLRLEDITRIRFFCLCTKILDIY